MTDSIPGDSPPPPPPPPTPGSPPPLVRSATDHYVAGVCGGLGAHFGISPTIFRLGFVALTFAGGFGVLLYIAAWILMPQAGSTQRMGWNPASPNRHTVRMVIAGLLVLVAVVMLAGSAHVGHGGLFVGVVLLGIGVLLLVQDRRQPTSDLAAAPPANPSLAYAGGAFASPSAATPASTWTPAVPAHPRSILGLVTLAAALLAAGVAALLDAAGVVSVTVATCAAIALIIVGAGLVAGTWFGRSRALIVLGVLLIPFTVTASLVDEPLNAGTGHVVVMPQGLADLRSEYHLAAGQLTVDLSQIPTSATSTVLVTVAFGDLTVVVPPQENLSIAAHAGAGRLDILSAADEGFNIDSPVNRSPSPVGGTLHLTLRVGFGQVHVIEASSIPSAPVGGQ